MTRWLLLSLALLVSVACGGKTDDDEGGASYGHFSANLPRDLRFDALTPAQHQQFCDALVAYNSDANWQAALADTCPWTSVFATIAQSPTTDAEAQAACQSYYDQCLLSPTPELGPDPCASIPSCAATIGDFEACANDHAAVQAASAAVPSCDTLTLADVNAFVRPPLSDGCTAMRQSCEDFRGGTP